jgi:hypothetical protein
LITEGKLDGGERLAKGAFRILTSHSWFLISLLHPEIGTLGKR